MQIDRSCTIRSRDGTRLAVSETGNRNGKPLLLIHGIAQSRLCFRKQTSSKLAERFRIVSFDLRGHGESDKPREAKAYTEGGRWADDVAAVIEHARLERPVLVGWSLGGRVIAQYLAICGDSAIAGINFVGSRTIIDPQKSTLGPGASHLVAMHSEDLATCIKATANFLKSCVAEPLPVDDLIYMMGYNMASPWYARASVLNWPGDFSRALSSVSVPCLVTHGRRDNVILPAAAELTAMHVPYAKLSWYEESGHSPFWEEPDRFNSELAELADRC